jgi:hypothetical protein
MAMTIALRTGRSCSAFIEASNRPNPLQGFARNFVSLKADVFQEIIRPVEQA